jgi:hypothetical protein
MYSTPSFDRPPIFKIVPTLIVLVIVVAIVAMFLNQGNISTVKNCKVIDLQQQMHIESDKGNTTTTYRYLVITDKETFVCENSLLNLKFNNSDIFWRLKKDSTYTFEVAGIGKSMLTEYRNILSYGLEKNR